MGRVTRRAVLATALSVALGGCLDSLTEGEDNAGDSGESDTGDNSSESDDDGTSNTGQPPGDDEMADDELSDAERHEQVEQLPDPRPIADELIDLFLAADREAFAADRDLAFRDGAVKVEIRLVQGGDPPQEYLPENRSEYGDTVVTYVDIDDLVSLALSEDVKRISRHFSPQNNL